MPNGGVVVAYLHPGTVSGDFCDSLTHLLLHDATHAGRVTRRGGIVSMASGPLLASSRNRIVEKFLGLDGAPEWLFFVDADMTFAADAIDRLVTVAVANGCRVVGGLCFAGGRGGVLEPTMFRWRDNPDGGIDKATITRWPDNALVEVGYTGCAALLVHREVLEAVGERWGEPSRWFAYGVDPRTGTEFGEDAVFCRRATEVGFPVHVFTGVEFGHVKTYVWGSVDYEAQRIRAAEVGEEVVAAEAVARRRPPLLPAPEPEPFANRQQRRAAERRKEAVHG